MSPEQAEMSGQDVDTRSDVYSLGVLLYELLTGTTPVDKDRLKQAGFDEVRRIIREEEPPRPSTRISTLSGRLPAAAAGRRGDLKKLGQLVRGELDWIVMKALEKDRARRYETVSGLAADVERYLKGEAVQACPPSAAYRVQKLLRKHKGPVIAASLVALALVAGIIGTTRGKGQERLAKEQEFLALVSQAHAERVSGRAGQRFDALETVKKAAAIRVTPELRAEAAAALALPDIKVEQEWDDNDPTGELTMSFDGPVIRYARVSQQGEVKICRVTNGREEVISRLPASGHSGIRGLWWSNDRRFLAYGHGGTAEGVGGAPLAGGALRVLKVDGPTPVVILDEPAGVNASAFAFHAGGRKCAFARVAGGVTVFDLDTGRGQLLPADGVVALAFHPTDGRLAIACADVVWIFDSHTGRKFNPLRPARSTDGVKCIAWHPLGRCVAMGVGSSIRLFDADSVAEVMPAWANRAVIESITFTHSGDQLLSWDGSQQTVLWEVASGLQLLTTPRVLEMNSTFSGDDRFVGFSRGEGKARVWRFESGRELRVLDNPDAAHRLDSLYGPVMDGTGRVFAAGSVGGERLSFFDTETGEELARISVPADSARLFAFDPTACGWLTGGTRGVMLWPLRSAPGLHASLRVGPPQSLRAGAGAPLALGPQGRMWPSGVSPNGKWVAACTDESEGPSKRLRIWNGRDGRAIADLPLARGPWQAEFSADSQWLTAYDRKEAAQVWKVGSWDKPAWSFTAGRISLSPDGRLMAVNDVIGCVRLLKTASGEEVARLTGPEQHVYWPQCFTPDGTKLIAMGQGLCVWDLRLIREQLRAMGLDWDHKDWPPFPPAVADARGLLRLTVDTGTSAQEGPRAATLRPQGRAPERGDPK
jgi:WD40 repeat protein